MITNEKKLREQVERTLEKERQVREEKKRQIAAIYAEIAGSGYGGRRPCFPVLCGSKEREYRCNGACGKSLFLSGGNGNL